MSKPIIHLLSVAGHCRPLLERLNFRSYSKVVELAQGAVGTRYEVRGDTALMNPKFDEKRGGRQDDARRCAVLNKVLADNHTVALVALRGGAWLTRLLPDIRFELLSRRRTTLHIFGFSELTTIINIAARYPRVRAWYEHDLGHLLPGDGDYRAAYVRFLQDLVSLVEGGGSDRKLHGQLVRGPVKPQQRIKVIGGNLAVMLTLLGSKYENSIDARGRWLALEDVHNDPYGIDRHLAQLKLAGAFDKCQGLLLGDFHLEDYEDGTEDQTPAVLGLLRFHLPARRKIPIVAHCTFGHCHPAGPLPINRPVTLKVGLGGKRRAVQIAERK